VGAPPPSLAQLDAYAKASVLYSQISGFQAWVMATATLFVTLTAGIWAAVLSGDLARGAELALCVAHLAATAWISGIFYGSFRSIRARFVMFDALGDAFFPEILHVGRASFRDGHPRWMRWLTSGAHGTIHRFFYLLPLSGAAGTAFLLVHEVF
jgi:hypothetical protein